MIGAMIGVLDFTIPWLGSSLTPSESRRLPDLDHFERRAMIDQIMARRMRPKPWNMGDHLILGVYEAELSTSYETPKIRWRFNRIPHPEWDGTYFDQLLTIDMEVGPDRALRGRYIVTENPDQQVSLTWRSWDGQEEPPVIIRQDHDWIERVLVERATNETRVRD